MKHLPNVLYHGISLDNIDSLISSHIVGFYVVKNEPDDITKENKNTIRKLAKIVDFLGYQSI